MRDMGAVQIDFGRAPGVLISSLGSSPLPSENRTRPGISKVFCHCVVAINELLGRSITHWAAT
jgi:hypothetical protein